MCMRGGDEETPSTMTAPSSSAAASSRDERTLPLCSFDDTCITCVCPVSFFFSCRVYIRENAVKKKLAETRGRRRLVRKKSTSFSLRRCSAEEIFCQSWRIVVFARLRRESFMRQLDFASLLVGELCDDANAHVRFWSILMFSRILSQMNIVIEDVLDVNYTFLIRISDRK